MAFLAALATQVAKCFQHASNGLKIALWAIRQNMRRRNGPGICLPAIDDERSAHMRRCFRAINVDAIILPIAKMVRSL